MNNKNNTSIIIFSLIFFGALIFGKNVSAAEYYVFPKASAILNNTDEGSAAWSLATSVSTPTSARTAFNRALAGDTVLFRAGIYNVDFVSTLAYDTAHYMPTNSGASDSERITFKNYPDEVPIFDLVGMGSTDYNQAIFGTSNKDYITYDGFKLIGNSGTFMAGVNSFYSTGGEFLNLEIDGGDPEIYFDSNADAFRIEQVSDVRISHCRVYDWTNSRGDHANTQIVKVYQTTGLIIENCEFTNSSNGIYLKTRGNGTIIRNNYIAGMRKQSLGAQVYTTGEVWETNNVIIDNNLIVGSGWRDLQATDEGPAGAEMNNWTIRNNTFYNMESIGSCMYLGNTASTPGNGYKIYNNILYGNWTAEVFYFRSGGISNSIIDQMDHNNYVTMAFRNYYYPASSVTLANWQSRLILAATYDAGCGSSLAPGCGSITANPEFVNASGNLNTIADFALSPDSPSEGTGRGGLNMGADVSLVGIQNGTVDIISPSAPLGLSVL